MTTLKHDDIIMTDEDRHAVEIGTLSKNRQRVRAGFIAVITAS